MTSHPFPAPPPSVPPTPIEELDRVVSALHDHKAAWLKVTPAERLALLTELKGRLLDLSHEWVALASRAKGYAPDSPMSGEEWLGGPVVTMRNLRLFETALAQLAADGTTSIEASRLSERPDGQLVAQVFPEGLIDKLLYGGVSCEVWMMPGVTRQSLPSTMAVHYKRPPEGGRVGLVLGAGNVNSIPVMDSLYKLFVENEVVVLKMNPINEYLGPIIRRLFKPLVDRGFLEVVYGGAKEGAHLAAHGQVDTLHVTGSDKTYDAIVWGPPEGRAERKARGERANTKPFTAELGNVTPVMVVPGQWTEAELNYQAAHVATLFANNASFNCNAAKVLVLAEGWAQRDAFLAKLKEVIARQPVRKAWYPGARDRWKRFVDAHPQSIQLAEGSADTVPWTFIGGLDPEAKDEICFTEESFCGVIYEVTLPAASATEFLPRAVTFCNERLWGTLACVLLIDPRTQKAPGVEAAFQQALSDLRYGGVAVNIWPGLIFGLTNCTWGAFPGHTPEDIQSGVGVVHNMYMFDQAQKAVLYGPFVMAPKPPWFVNHGRTHRVAERTLRMEAGPSLLKVPGIAIQALLG